MPLGPDNRTTFGIPTEQHLGKNDLPTVLKDLDEILDLGIEKIPEAPVMGAKTIFVAPENQISHNHQVDTAVKAGTIGNERFRQATDAGRFGAGKPARPARLR